MATVSFDEKVVVTDPDTVAKMKKDFNDPSPVVFQKVPNFTYEKAQENATRWLEKINKTK